MTEPPVDGRLPLQARRMLIVLRERGDWVKSTDLTQVAGLSHLTRHQMGLLKTMVDRELIEVRPPFTSARGRTPYEYGAQAAPPASVLTLHAQRLLDVLSGAGLWLTREEIAQKMGKAQLSPHDVGVLRKLMDKEFITSRPRPVPRRGPSIYEFRVKHREQQ